jgi:CBS domain-containing protein
MDVRHTPAPTLLEDAPFPRVVEGFLDSQDPYCYLVDSEQKLAGAVFLHDVKGFLGEGGLEGLVIARDLARPVFTTTYPEETLAECLRKFTGTGFEQLPVVEGIPVSKLVGVVTQRDLIDLYDREVLRKEFLGTISVATPWSRSALTLPRRYTVVPFPFPTEFAKKTLKELNLRARYGVTVIAVRTETSTGPRDDLPQPEQPLQAGEILILAGHREDIAKLQRSVPQPSQPS